MHDTAEFHGILVASVRDYAIFALDSTGHILTWNIGAERLKGYTRDEIVGKHFSIFYPQEAIASRHPWHELEVASIEGRYEEEGWRLRKDGSRFWANVTITALRDETGTLVGFAKVTRDLTDRRAAELRRLDDARRAAEAEAASRTKSEFLAAMSHELRTPLNAIGGYVDLLTHGVHGPLNGAQMQALERVRSSQRHLLALITDLLDYNKIESGRIAYDIEDVALTDVTKTLRPLIEPRAGAKNISVEWPARDDSVYVTADRGKLEQILLNILVNAITYTEPGGRIRFDCTKVNDHTRIDITDTGIGIPADRVDSVFEPFTQVGRSLTSAHQGAGLGLAISRDLAHDMGGDLTVRSEVGAGSTFTLILPATPSTD